MRKSGFKAAPVVVLSSGWSPIAYDIVRTLGLRHVSSTVASSQASDIAFYSRYCTERVVLPDFDPLNYRVILESLQTVRDILRTKPVLFYASDPELLFVWTHRHQLAECYRFLLPPYEILEQLVNKVLFVEFAARHGLSIPDTYIVRDVEEVRSRLDSLPLPCIVKPAFSPDWAWKTEKQRKFFGSYKKALRRFNSKDELLRFCEILPKNSSGFLVQHYLDGRDEQITSFHGYFDENSRCLGYFLGRKIRTYPPHNGGSAYVQTIHDPELAKSSIYHLQRIGFRGIVKIDYKWDERTKEFKFLEVNPRYNLWELLGAYAGVNLSYIAYCHQHGEPQEIDEHYRDDVRLLFLKQDFRAFWTGYSKIGEWTFHSYLRSLLRRNYYRILDPYDPIPFCISVFRFWIRSVLHLLRVVQDRRSSAMKILTGRTVDKLDPRTKQPKRPNCLPSGSIHSTVREQVPISVQHDARTLKQ